MTTIASIILAAAFNLHTDRVGSVVILPDWAPDGSVNSEFIAGNDSFNTRFSTNSYAAVASLIDGLYERDLIGYQRLRDAVMTNPTNDWTMSLWEVPKETWTNLYALSWNTGMNDDFEGIGSVGIRRILPNANRMVMGDWIERACRHSRLKLKNFGSLHLDEILGNIPGACDVSYVSGSWSSQIPILQGSAEEISRTLVGFGSLSRGDLYNPDVGPLPYDHECALTLLHGYLSGRIKLTDDEEEALDKILQALEKMPATASDGVRPTALEVVLDGMGAWTRGEPISPRGVRIAEVYTNDEYRISAEKLAMANRTAGEMESMLEAGGHAFYLRFADVNFNVMTSTGINDHNLFQIDLSSAIRGIEINLNIDAEDLVAKASTTVSALTNAYTFTDVCSFIPFARTPGFTKQGSMSIQSTSSHSVEQAWHQRILRDMSGDVTAGDMGPCEICLAVRILPFKDYDRIGYTTSLVGMWIPTNAGVENKRTIITERKYAINGPVWFDTSTISARLDRPYKAQFSLYDDNPKVEDLLGYSSLSLDRWVNLDSVSIVGVDAKFSIPSVKGVWFDGGDPVKSEFMASPVDKDFEQEFRRDQHLTGKEMIRSKERLSDLIRLSLFDRAKEARELLSSDLADPITFTEASPEDIRTLVGQVKSRFTGEVRFAINEPTPGSGTVLVYKTTARIVGGKLDVMSIDGFSIADKNLDSSTPRQYGQLPDRTVLGAIVYEGHTVGVYEEPRKAYTCDIPVSKAVRINFKFDNLHP